MGTAIRRTIAALALMWAPATVWAEPAPTTAEAETCPLEDRRVVGAVEIVELQPDGPGLPARIDTGATTSSLDARDIEPFERDGKRWVRFRVVDRESEESVELERRVTRVVNIKRHGAPDQDRYVVELSVRMGDWKSKVEFSLTDREKYSYPVLVGRNILGDGMVVDVSGEYLLGAPGGAK